jgi:NADH dehydrogenase [ubiquinone] 1 alpha subcomplex assembly factor 6
MSSSVMHKKSERKKVDTKTANDAMSYCNDLVKKRDYENYLASLLMPAEAKPKVIANLAFNAEVSIIRQKIKRNSGVSGINQLKFWKDALNTLFGELKGPIPRQPILTALNAYGSDADLPLYLKLVAAREATLGDRPYESVQKLEESGKDINGTLIKLIGNSLEQELNDSFENAANNMGAAVTILTLLRATIPLLREGIVLLPNDLMSIHGLSPDKVYNNKNPDGLKALTSDLLNVADKNLKKSRSCKNDISPIKRQALLGMGIRCDYLLQLLRKNKCNLFEERVHQPDPFLSWKLYYRKLRKSY